MRLRASNRKIPPSAISRSPKTMSQMFSSSIALIRKYPDKLLGQTFSGSLIFFCGFQLFFGTILPNLFLTKNPDSILRQSFEIAFQVLLATFVTVPAMIVGISLVSWPICQVVVKELYNFETRNSQKVKVPPVLSTNFKQIFYLCFAVMARIMAPYLIVLGLLTAAAFAADSKMVDLSALFTGLAILGGMIGTVWLFVDLPNLAFSLPIVMIERLPIKKAFGRSKYLTKFGGYPKSGGFDGIVLIVLFLGLLLASFNGLVQVFWEFIQMDFWLNQLSSQSAFGLILSRIISSAPLLVGMAFALPLFICTIFIFYIDRRIRLEAYDIELLARQNEV